MFIKSLKIENLRNLEQVEIVPHSDFNVIFGDNGAGKTSILESIVVLSRGRSFRTSQAAELIGKEGSQFRIFAETVRSGKYTGRLGLERSGKHWRGKKDGQDLAQLSQLTRALPLVVMEPNSHLLVTGTPELRRKYLDWGLFHVEHGFLDTYRRFVKTLKQRNAALRQRQSRVVDSIDDVFVSLAEDLDRMRKEYCLAIAQQLQAHLQRLSANLPGFGMEYQQGWPGRSLREALDEHRESDQIRGATSNGPHRGDLLLTVEKASARGLLSRGEQKILAAAMLLSQAALLSETGEKPILLLDDLSSEFDQQHFENVLEMALEIGGQVWLTGILRKDTTHAGKVFHVEHGIVREMV